jgi:hypothetical protein
MYDLKISTLILGFIKDIQDAIAEPEVIIWPESDLFLELQRHQGELIEDDDGQAHCGYYFVHDPSWCIYWPEEVTLKPFTSKILASMWGDLSGYQTSESLMIDSFYIKDLTDVQNYALKLNTGALPLFSQFSKF